MKKINKIFVIGLLILLVGTTLSPMISSSPLQKNEKTMEINISQLNENIFTYDQKLPVEDITILKEIISSIKIASNDKELDVLIDRLLSFFENRGLNLGFLSDGILSDSIVVSFGTENHLRPTYIPKIKFSKFFHMWKYSSDWSTTIIMDSILSIPSHLLQGRQIGFMIGFKGIYVYIPDWIPGLENLEFFIGTTPFAWGMDF